MKGTGLFVITCASLLLTGCGDPRSSGAKVKEPALYRGSLDFTMETASQPAGTFKASSSLAGLTLARGAGDRYQGSAPANVAITYTFPDAVCDASSVKVTLDLQLDVNANMGEYGVSGTAPLSLHTRCCAGADCRRVDAETVLGFSTSCDKLPDVLLTARERLVEVKRRTECGDPASGTVISTLSWKFDAQ
jgi:hypothetical protein